MECASTGILIREPVGEIRKETLEWNLVLMKQDLISSETYDADVGSDDCDDSAFISTEPKPTETGPSPFMEQMLKEENGGKCPW
jgi:hypothetical protein